MIEVQHLTKRYGRVTAVDDVSFRVERGEILGFLGPNGAGKTTTMRVITGYMPPTEGSVDRGRLRRLRTAHRGQAADGLPARDAAALPGHDRPRVPRVRRAHQGRGGGRAQGPRREGHGADLGRRHGGPPLRQALEGLPPARRPRAGDPAQSRRPGARRADGRPRPEADHRDPPAHQGTGRQPHDHPEHAHPARGRADLPARRHHQQGPGGGGRHPRQPHAPAERRGDDVRAGRRRRRDRPAAARGRRRGRARGRPPRRGRGLRGRERARRRHPARPGPRGRDERLGPARTAAAADEPRGDLPPGDHRGRSRPRSRRRRPRYEQRPGDRPQGNPVVLRVADRLHRDRAVRAALRLFLRRDPGLVRPAGHAGRHGHGRRR